MIKPSKAGTIAILAWSLIFVAGAFIDAHAGKNSCNGQIHNVQKELKNIKDYVSSSRPKRSTLSGILNNHQIEMNMLSLCVTQYPASGYTNQLNSLMDLSRSVLRKARKTKLY